MSAKRVAMRRAKREWEKSSRGVAEEAAGLWQAELIRADSPHRPETVTATLDWFTALARRGNFGPLYLTCDTEFRWPSVLPLAMFYLAPHMECPKSCSIGGICRDCAALPDREVLQRALGVWGKVMPNAREIDPANLHPAGGRA